MPQKHHPQKCSSLEMEVSLERDTKKFKSDSKVKGKVVDMTDLQEESGKCHASIRRERKKKSVGTCTAKQKSESCKAVPERKCSRRPFITKKGAGRVTKNHKRHEVAQLPRSCSESDDTIDFTAIESKIFDNVSGDQRRVVQRFPKERKEKNGEKKNDQGEATNRQKKTGKRKTDENWKESCKKETDQTKYEPVCTGSSKGAGTSSLLIGKGRKCIRDKKPDRVNATESFDHSTKKHDYLSASTSGSAKDLGHRKDGKKRKTHIDTGGRTQEDLDSETELSDWQEVDEVEEIVKGVATGRNPSVAQQQNVQIVLDAPALWGKRQRRKRKTEDEMIEDYLRKQVNRGIKELYENMHKCHLLCLLAHGRFVNMTLNTESLLGAALSVITSKECYPPKRLDINFLEKFVKWFRNRIEIVPDEMEVDYWSIPLEKILQKRLEMKKACSQREQVFLYVLMSRALGMSVRLVMSLQPMSWKPKSDILIKPRKGTDDTSKEEQSINKCIEESLKKKNLNKKMLSSDSDEICSSIKVENKGKIQYSRTKNREAYKTKGKRSGSITSEEGGDYDDNEESDYDFAVKKSSGKSSKSKTAIRHGKRKCADESIEKKIKKKKKEPLLEWAEVFVEEEERWVCVDITTGKIHCAAEIECCLADATNFINPSNPSESLSLVSTRVLPYDPGIWTPPGKPEFS